LIDSGMFWAQLLEGYARRKLYEKREGMPEIKSAPRTEQDSILLLEFGQFLARI
jgi:hypothetical protein